MVLEITNFMWNTCFFDELISPRPLGVRYSIGLIGGRAKRPSFYGFFFVSKTVFDNRIQMLWLVLATVSNLDLSV